MAIQRERLRPQLKQTKNKCTILTKTAKKQYYAKSVENQPLTNKSFWNSIPFLTYKNVTNYVITLNEKGQLINDELEVAETLNSHYTNIVKTTCGEPPQALGNPKDQANDIASVDAIISNYKTIQVLFRLEKNALILRYIVFLKQKRGNKYTIQASESQKGNRS